MRVKIQGPLLAKNILSCGGRLRRYLGSQQDNTSKHLAYNPRSKLQTKPACYRCVVSFLLTTLPHPYRKKPGYRMKK